MSQNTLKVHDLNEDAEFDENGVEVFDEKALVEEEPSDNDLAEEELLSDTALKLYLTDQGTALFRCRRPDRRVSITFGNHHFKRAVIVATRSPYFTAVSRSPVGICSAPASAGDCTSKPTEPPRLFTSSLVDASTLAGA